MKLVARLTAITLASGALLVILLGAIYFFGGRVPFKTRICFLKLEHAVEMRIEDDQLRLVAVHRGSEEWGSGAD